MEKTIIYNLIILDESGSMSSIKSQAIGGFNETVQTIKNATEKYPEQNHFVSLVTFNGSAIKTVYDRLPVNNIKELDGSTYRPHSMTPLYDAMGKALVNLKKAVQPDDKVLVTIITDGEENASREYNSQIIKALVEELKAKNWVFAYIGANQDAKEVAATISINNYLNFEATEMETEVMFAKTSVASTRFFSRLNKNEDMSKMESDFFKDDDE